MKTIIVCCAAVFAAAALEAQEPGGTFELRAKVPLESKTIKDAPYSAEIANDHTQSLTDGNRIVRHSTGRVYRDKDGRVRREEDRADGTSAVSIVDPVAGVSYSLDPVNHIAWKTPVPAGNVIVKKLAEAKMQDELKLRRDQQGAANTTFVQGSTDPQQAEADLLKRKQAAEAMTLEIASGQVTAGRVVLKSAAGGIEQHNDEALAARTIEGVRAEGHRMTTTIPAGAIGNDWPIVVVSEEWVSPELQVLVMTERKDPRNGDSSYRLLNIRRDDPSASLFQVPLDYIVKETKIRYEFSRQLP